MHAARKQKFSPNRCFLRDLLFSSGESLNAVWRLKTRISTIHRRCDPNGGRKRRAAAACAEDCGGGSIERGLFKTIDTIFLDCRSKKRERQSIIEQPKSAANYKFFRRRPRDSDTRGKVILVSAKR